MSKQGAIRVVFIDAQADQVRETHKQTLKHPEFAHLEKPEAYARYLMAQGLKAHIAILEEADRG